MTPSRRGLSLLEIIAIMVMIAIFATLAVATTKSINRNSRNASRLRDINAIQSALASYKNLAGYFPLELKPGQPLVTTNGQTILDKVPSDPDGKLCGGYRYYPIDNGRDYNIRYCLGHQFGSIKALTYFADGSKINNLLGYKCFENCAWQNIGKAGFSAGKAYYSSMIVTGDYILVAAKDDGHGGQVQVFRYNLLAPENGWENYSQGLSSGVASWISLATDGQKTYLAYRDNTNGYLAYVKELVGDQWQTVGNHSASSSRVEEMSLAIFNGQPVIAYRDEARSNRLSVLGWNGQSWTYLGQRAFNGHAVYQTSLVTDGKKLYVAYRETGSSRFTVSVLENGDWVDIGVQLSVGLADYVSVAVSQGNVYVACQDQGQGYKAIVWKYLGKPNSWQVVGGGPASDRQANYVRLSAFANQLYIGFQDADGKAIVREYTTNGWQNIGQPNFTEASTPWISFDQYQNNLFVAGQDGNNNGRLSVWQYRQQN